MKKILFILLTLTFFSCNKLDETIEKKKVESQKNSEATLMASQEISAYTDCVLEAKTTEDETNCEKLKANFSDRAKEIVESSEN